MNNADDSSGANKNINAVGDIAFDGYPFIRTYKDGRIERLLRSPFVPASVDPAANRGVATRDVVIDSSCGVSARIFLPSSGASAAGRSSFLPVIVYFHGGAFCTESTFGRTYHGYATSLASRSRALVVSVEYRLAPEHSVPAAYEDAWAAVRWVASLTDPWLADHADPGRTFFAGDSAGGNIAFNTAIRAGRDGCMGAVEGLVMVHPYFWGASRLPSETAWDGAALFPPAAVDTLWPFLTACQAGNDDPRIDPPEQEVASLSCRRALVAVAERDTLRDRGRQLASRMRGCGWWAEDEVRVVESEGEDHGFHLYNPLRATSKHLMQSIVQFIDQTPRVRMDLAQAVISMPSRPYNTVLVCSGPGSTACHAVGSRSSYGLYLGQMKPKRACRKSLLAAAPFKIVMKIFM